jgi:hypothetical protein
MLHTQDISYHRNGGSILSRNVGKVAKDELAPVIAFLKFQASVVIGGGGGVDGCREDQIII